MFCGLLDGVWRIVVDRGTGRNACATERQKRGPAKFERDANCAQEAGGTKNKRNVERAGRMPTLPGKRLQRDAGCLR